VVDRPIEFERSLIRVSGDCSDGSRVPVVVPAERRTPEDAEIGDSVDD